MGKFSIHWCYHVLLNNRRDKFPVFFDTLKSIVKQEVNLHLPPPPYAKPVYINNILKYILFCVCIQSKFIGLVLINVHIFMLMLIHISFITVWNQIFDILTQKKHSNTNLIFSCKWEEFSGITLTSLWKLTSYLYEFF